MKYKIILMFFIALLFLPLTSMTIAQENQTLDLEKDDCLWLHRWSSPISFGDYDYIMDPQCPAKLGYMDTQEVTLSPSQIVYWYSPPLKKDTTISPIIGDKGPWVVFIFYRLEGSSTSVKCKAGWIDSSNVVHSIPRINEKTLTLTQKRGFICLLWITEGEISLPAGSRLTLYVKNDGPSEVTLLYDSIYKPSCFMLPKANPSIPPIPEPTLISILVPLIGVGAVLYIWKRELV